MRQDVSKLELISSSSCLSQNMLSYIRLSWYFGPLFTETRLRQMFCNCKWLLLHIFKKGMYVLFSFKVIIHSGEASTARSVIGIYLEIITGTIVVTTFLVVIKKMDFMWKKLLFIAIENRNREGWPTYRPWNSPEGTWVSMINI